MEDGKQTEDISRRMFKPSKDEIYIILLKDEANSMVYSVSSINPSESTISFIDSKEKLYTFELDNDNLILKSKKLDYDIIDIERVIPFDLDVLKEDQKQLSKVLTSDIIDGLDIKLSEIKDKEIIYTDSELREELLSCLVDSFDAYEKINMIKLLNNYVDSLFNILKNKDDRYNYLKNIPDWLIPIVDNPIKVYREIINDDGAEINESNHIIEDLSELPNTGGNDYIKIIRSILDILRPVNPSFSDIGYTTNNIRKYFRDCLTNNSCVGYNGNYTFDKRFNKLSYISDSEIIHKSDMLNIIGLLYIPDSQLIQCLDVMKMKHINLSKKVILQKIINNKYLNIINLRKQTIITKYLDSTHSLLNIVEGDIDKLISYLFRERITEDKFYEEIYKLTPSPEKIIDSIDDTLKSKLLNYDDIQLLLSKYNLDISKISKESRKYIHKLLKDNYNEYVKNIKVLPKVLLKKVKKELSIDYRISKSLELIFSIKSISIRNEYLQTFIRMFSREPMKNEDKNSLYNMYSNDKLLCKHYLFSSCYHKNPDSHASMVSIYGMPPKDGVIYCKHCGEYLCDEDFSTFDGFVGETTIQLREVMQTDIDLLKEYNEEHILLVKQIITSFGINPKDEDIAFILNIYSSINQDTVISTRYNSSTITDTYPLIGDIKKKFEKDKHKKEKIKVELKKLQVFFKDTNKLLSLVALCIITIQSSVPTYKNKYNYEFNLLQFTDISIQNITYNTKVIDFCLVRLDKLSTNSDSSIWLNYKQLLTEEKMFDLNSTKEQILNLIKYFISPQYNSIQNRVLDYIQFIITSDSGYIKDEWVLYRPLRNNKEISKTDKYIHSLNELYKPYFILNYNNYPIENVSMIKSLTESNSRYISEDLNISLSEIMVNKSFLLIFRLVVSHYGIYKGNSMRLHLHIDRFIQTVKQKEMIESIFTKNGYRKDKYISYKLLRNKIIPEIINNYTKDKQLLETCYSDEKICNRFIHININNYDYLMINVNPKRFYSYKPPQVYPIKDFDDLSESFIDKVFRRYCKDPNDKIIYRKFNNNYLGKVLLVDELDVELPNKILELEIPLVKDKTSFQSILDTIQIKSLKPSLYIKPEFIDYEIYKKDILSQYIESEFILLQVLRKNSNFNLQDDFPIFNTLTTFIEDKYPKSFTKGNIIREFDKSFSELEIERFIINISSFIHNIDSKPHKKRFENIFINTSESKNISTEDRRRLEKDNFRYRNLRESDIAKLILFFADDKRNSIDIIRSYINHLSYILAKLKNEPGMNSYIPKEWKLTEDTRNLYKQYIHKNSNYLYQDLFKQRVTYTGYMEYMGSYRYIFLALSKYIEPYIKELDRLHITGFSILNNTHMMMITRYLLMFLINRLIDFHTKVKQNDSEILSLIEEFITDEELDIPTVEQYTEYFIMDYITDILNMQYNSKGLVSNNNIDELNKRLGKQKEKEKQTLIHKLDTMSDEKRLLTMEKQKSGVINFFKTSGQENVSRVIDEYTNIPDDERYSMFNNLLSEDNIIDEVSSIYNGELSGESITVPLTSIDEEVGYIEVTDIDEDGQTGDELHEFHDEELFDNEFR
tara:strand:- start:204 stop:4919 length:4716 start_codon:yes stop_codon:yes gene_type:complete